MLERDKEIVKNYEKAKKYYSDELDFRQSGYIETCVELKKFKGCFQTKLRKRLLMDAMRHTWGNISLSCEMVKVSRTCFYKWLAKDKEFSRLISDLEEIRLDFVENKLMVKVGEGDMSAITFFLRTKGRKRGYTEKQEIEHSGELDINVESMSDAQLQAIVNEKEKEG